MLKFLRATLSFGLVLASLSAVSTGAFAKVDNIVGSGGGGSTHGDQTSACGLAFGRASSDANGRCFSMNGQVISSQPGSCHCHKEHGSSHNIGCDAQVFVQCNRPPVVLNMTAQGNGGTTVGDRNAACEKASERSASDLAGQCFSRQGILLDQFQGQCDCHKHPGSHDDYSCEVESRGHCQI